MGLRFRGLDAPIEVQYWKGGSPPVPDPNVQITAEKGAQRYNVTGPGGSTSWKQGPQTIMGYDQNGKPLYGTVDTQTTTLSPDEQKQYDTRNQIANAMLTGAAGQIPDMVNSPYDSGAQFDYNTDTPDAAKAAYTRQVALLQPTFDKQNRAFDQKMANAGIPVGSEAYNDAKRQQDNDQNFALTDAASGAQQEGAQMAFQQHAANLQQGLTERQQRYNELAAALGSEQLQPVGAFGSGGGSGVDASGAFNAANNAKLAGYNAGVASDNANMQAGVGLAGTAALAAAMMY